MKIKETKLLQSQRLKEICNDKEVDFESIETLLDSVKTKKLNAAEKFPLPTPRSVDFPDSPF